MTTRVVNVRYGTCDVYIGRAVHSRPSLRPCGWGNPFKIGRDGDRAEVIARYRAWVQRQPRLLARLSELRGKTLGCWCAPFEGLPGNLDGHICHGEVLAALADALETDGA